MTLYVTVETPLTAAELAENKQLVKAWKALTRILEDRDILWIDDMDITLPTVHRKLVRAEGPEPEPVDRGPFGDIVSLVPVVTPFRSPTVWSQFLSKGGTRDA
jgi:hypothetical protein